MCTRTRNTSYIMALTLLGFMPQFAFADWSGAYAGASVGLLATGEATGDDDGEELSSEIDGGAIVGGFGGYQVQRDALVFGGEVALSFANEFEIDTNGFVDEADFRILDIKARAGYDLGDTLIYGVAGLSLIEVDGDTVEGADETAEGFNIGLGADYRINDQVTVGAEYLARRLVLDDDFDTEITTDTVAVRASFNF